MANYLNLPLVLRVSFIIIYADLAATTPKNASGSGDTLFVNSSCMATLYPTVCIKCLSGYASTVNQDESRLALTALSVSLAQSRSAKAFVSKTAIAKASILKKMESQAVNDCIDNIADGVDRLAESVKEMGLMQQGGGRYDFLWHISNVQTWVSATITDLDTCLDGFATVDGSVMPEVKGVVTSAKQVASNALALVNRFAQKQRRG